MSKGRSDNSSKDNRELVDVDRRSFFGMIGRVAIKLTGAERKRGFWQVVGAILPDAHTPQAEELEQFSGIGFYARPRVGSNPEAITACVGADAQNKVIIATRDEKLRRKMANLGEDETAMYNSLAAVTINDNGFILVGSDNVDSGTQFQLAKNDDLNALAAWVRAQFAASTGHSHAVAGPSTISVVPAASTSPTGPYVGSSRLRTD